MPNRIVRPGINDSRAVNQLSESAEIFYRRLMLITDEPTPNCSAANCSSANSITGRWSEWRQH